MAGRKLIQKQKPLVEEDLDRFAGSSDEEEVNKTELRNRTDHDADNEDESFDEEERKSASSSEEDKGQDESAASDLEESETEDGLVLDLDSSAKMANAMARILGTSGKGTASSVVLGKTTTPLQKMQQEEKVKWKALKEKRQANRERNLSALHIPLSVATASVIKDGRHPVTRELQQERFHRRVATRGVVALFNAISNHQKSKELQKATAKHKRESKLTKHGFLDKIKSAAASATSSKVASSDSADDSSNVVEKRAANWDALKEDYMLNSKKNWDQESSDEASNFEEDSLDLKEAKEGDERTKKKRRTTRRQ